jgi:hypothetical protein
MLVRSVHFIRNHNNHIVRKLCGEGAGRLRATSLVVDEVPCTSQARSAGLAAPVAEVCCEGLASNECAHRQEHEHETEIQSKSIELHFCLPFQLSPPIGCTCIAAPYYSGREGYWQAQAAIRFRKVRVVELIPTDREEMAAE